MLNVCEFQGRFTKDPELKQTQGGVSVVAFTLACERDYKTGGKRETDFFNFVAWRNTAEFIARYFHKGDMAVVAGPAQVRSYTDKSGNKRDVVEFIVEKIYFSGEPRKASNMETEFQELDDDDELPF